MAKRPLIYCIPIFTAAVWICTQFSVQVSFRWLLLAMSGFLIVLAVLLEKKIAARGLLLVLCALAGAAYASGYEAAFVTPLHGESGATKLISAVVMEDAQVYEDSQRAEILVEKSSEMPYSFRLLCYFPKGDQLLAGDRVESSVSFYRFSASDGFDRQRYYASQGIYLGAEYEKDTDGQAVHFVRYPQQAASELRFWPQHIAKRIKEILQNALSGRDSAILTAMLLGDRSAVSDWDNTVLRKAGLSHLTAVSGMHVGFLVSFFFLIFGKRRGTALSIFAVLAFMALAGFTPSVMRAGIMYIITAAAFCFNRQADSLTCLFLAVFLLLLKNPFILLSTGLQLSFAACLGLILFSGRLFRWFNSHLSISNPIGKKAVMFLSSALCCTLCANIFTVPIAMLTFGYVSILSPISNLCVTGVTALCFIGGFLLCACGLFSAAASGLIGMVLHPFLFYFFWIAEKIASVQNGLIFWGDRFGIAALLVCGLSVAAIALMQNPARRKTAAVLCLIVFVGLMVARDWEEKTNMQVDVLASGAGQSILLSYAHRELILIDCSGSSHRNSAEAVEEWMQWHGYDKIDSLILTAVSKGYARNVPDLLNRTQIEKIYLPQNGKKNKQNKEIWNALSNATIPQGSILEEQNISEFMKCMAFPVADGKTGVRIGNSVLILSSVTQKQLAAYLQDHTEQPAQYLILSETQLADNEMLAKTLGELQPETIILESAVMPAKELNHIPIVSTFEKGALQYKFSRKEIVT